MEREIRGCLNNIHQRYKYKVAGIKQAIKWWIIMLRVIGGNMFSIIIELVINWPELSEELSEGSYRRVIGELSQKNGSFR